MTTFSHALVRSPSPKYAAFYADRDVSISQELAHEQHSRYVRELEASGVRVRFVAPDAAFPDCVFIEDTALVWDRRALATRMVPHREGEQGAVEAALSQNFEIVGLPVGATLDGGDVLHLEQRTYVGLSSRTNAAGVGAVAEFLTPFGRPVVPVPVRKCLHLKSAVTYLGNDTILAAPEMVDLELFGDLRIILTGDAETQAANCLRLSDRVLLLEGYPETSRRVQQFAAAHGLRAVAMPMSEFEKGDGSLTCLSLLW